MSMLLGFLATNLGHHIGHDLQHAALNVNRMLELSSGELYTLDWAFFRQDKEVL